MTQFIGIDVSRSTLDVAILGGPHFRASNSPAGFESIAARLPSNPVICMEATGVYFRPFAVYLRQQDFTVYVANPKQVRDFANARLARNKTDKADARLIAEFGCRFQPDLHQWDAVSDAHFALALVVRFADGLTRHRVALLNRLHALEFVRPSAVPLFEPAVLGIGMERKRVYAIAHEIIHSDSLLLRWFTSLKTLPGFADVAAPQFLAYSNDLRWYPTASHFASYTGLTPKLKHSGNARPLARISRMGPPRLRGVLGFAALSASASHTHFGEFYQHLIENGKPKGVAQTALAHKLGRAAWAVCVKG